ncbi:MAG: hypothetical protein R3Y10_07785 [Ferrimonas sp.]
MWRLVLLLCLSGCTAYQSSLKADSKILQRASSVPTSWLTVALNQQDLPLLTAAFQPQHPLLLLDSSFITDDYWPIVSREWIVDLIQHGADGDWQLRSIQSLKDRNRLQYRLVHKDYSVEYFYFDIAKTESGVKILDLGNRLYHYSQVKVMGELYRRLIMQDFLEQENFLILFDYISDFNNGRINHETMLHAYNLMPILIQQDRLVRELLLRAMMGYQAPAQSSLLGTKLLGNDYALLGSVICMQQDLSSCTHIFHQLPEELQKDIALVTEMGIRQLNNDNPLAAQRYAQYLNHVKVDYFPAYWFQLQLDIANQDHYGAVICLENLMQRFDVEIDKEMVLQLYPERGKRFFQSDPFKRWAQRYQAEEY